MKITQVAVLFHRRCRRSLAGSCKLKEARTSKPLLVWRERKRWNVPRMSGLEGRVILRHVVSTRTEKKRLNLFFSLLLYGIDANRCSIDSRSSVKLILLLSAPSGSTTSHKISWEPKGASLLLRRSSSPWAVLLPSLHRRLLYILFLSFYFIQEEVWSLPARLPSTAVCFSESGSIRARTFCLVPQVDKICSSRTSARCIATQSTRHSLECPKYRFITDKSYLKIAKYLPCPFGPLCIFMLLSFRDRRMQKRCYVPLGMLMKSY